MKLEEIAGGEQAPTLEEQRAYIDQELRARRAEAFQAELRAVTLEVQRGANADEEKQRRATVQALRQLAENNRRSAAALQRLVEQLTEGESPAKTPEE